MKKRFISVLMIFVMLFAFNSNAFAYSRSINFNASEASEIHAQYMPAGSWNGKIGVSSMTSSSSNPQLFEVLYGEGFTVLSRTFTSAGYSTKHYSIAGLTYMHFSAEKMSSGNINANVNWEYNY